MALATFEDVARHAKSLCQCDAPTPLVAQWASKRLAEVAGHAKLRSFRRLRGLVIPGAYSTGTVSVTRGSQTVTGASTAWTTAYDGYYLRAATVWYKVAQVNTATQLVLESPYAEDTATGVSYTLVKRFHSLGTDVQTLSAHSFTHARTAGPLQVLSWDELNRLFPARHYGSGGIPAYVCEVDPGPDGSRQLEVFPYPAESELIYYLAWIKPPDYAMTEPLPGFILPYGLVEGTLVDLYGYKASEQTDANLLNIWANKQDRQRVLWEGKISEILVQEKGLSDTQFFVESLARRRGSVSGDITNAYQQVWLGIQL